VSLNASGLIVDRRELPALYSFQTPPSAGKTAGKSTLDRLPWVDRAIERPLAPGTTLYVTLAEHGVTVIPG
jgi:hypothetical protein